MSPPPRCGRIVDGRCKTDARRQSMNRPTIIELSSEANASARRMRNKLTTGGSVERDTPVISHGEKSRRKGKKQTPPRRACAVILIFLRASRFPVISTKRRQLFSRVREFRYGLSAVAYLDTTNPREYFEKERRSRCITLRLNVRSRADRDAGNRTWIGRLKKESRGPEEVRENSRESEIPHFAPEFFQPRSYGLRRNCSCSSVFSPARTSCTSRRLAVLAHTRVIN